MPRFSANSELELSTCHPQLVRLFHRVVLTFDCTVIDGHRIEAAQNAAFESGHSRVRWPNSRHNTFPSLAADVAPYPIDWRDLPRFYLFAGYVLGVAAELGISIRWGGDWDGDRDLRDQRFNDLVHFELATVPRSASLSA